MPATSQQQQKLMGLVHALQKGTVKPSQASKKAQQQSRHRGKEAWIAEFVTIEAPLTNNELKARRIGSDKTIARVRRELWLCGFLDVVRTGSFSRPGLFRLSERWKQYPHGDYKPKGQQSPGFCHYPDNIRHRNKKKT